MPGSVCVIVFMLLLASLAITGPQSVTYSALGSTSTPPDAIAHVVVSTPANTPSSGPQRMISYNTEQSGIISRTRHQVYEVRSSADGIWSQIRSWVKKPRLPNLSMKTAWLSTWSMGIRWVQQSSAYAVNYYDRLTRYLQGVREHEQRMQELRASYDPNQPLSETSSLALSASRKDVIEFIAARVGLRPDEVPYLAFAGEPVVRIQVQQKYGVGPLKPIQDIWGQAYQGMGRAIHPWSRWLGRLSRNVRDWTEILIATINLMPRVIGSLVLGYVVLDVFKFLKWLGRCFELL